MAGRLDSLPIARGHPRRSRCANRSHTSKARARKVEPWLTQACKRTRLGQRRDFAHIYAGPRSACDGQIREEEAISIRLSHPIRQSRPNTAQVLWFDRDELGTEKPYVAGAAHGAQHSRAHCSSYATPGLIGFREHCGPLVSYEVVIRKRKRNPVIACAMPSHGGRRIGRPMQKCIQQD